MAQVMTSLLSHDPLPPMSSKCSQLAQQRAKAQAKKPKGWFPQPNNHHWWEAGYYTRIGMFPKCDGSQVM